MAAVNSICRGSGLISPEAPPGALLLLPVTPGIRRCDMPSASLTSLLSSCNFLSPRFMLPVIGAFGGYEPRREYSAVFYFPEQERRRKCSDESRR